MPSICIELVLVILFLLVSAKETAHQLLALQSDCAK